nr:hypothetical protein [Burkholderia stagnalis]
MTIIDLASLDPPDLVDVLDFEAAYQMKLEFFKSIYPDWTAALESDPVVKLIELAAYDEIRAAARVNDAARAMMLAFSTGRIWSIWRRCSTLSGPSPIRATRMQIRPLRRSWSPTNG